MPMATSAEAWTALAGLLDRGPLAVVWHEGSESARSGSGSRLPSARGPCQSRTEQQGKVTTAGGCVKPGRLCWADTWTRERSSVTHWPYLNTVLDMVQAQQQRD